MRKCIAFDDVLLVPVYSEGRSRLDVDTSTKIGPIKLEIPLISSPMDTVTESKMAIALGRAGGMGVLHRFMSPLEQALEIRKIIDLSGSVPLVPAIGVTDSEKSRFRYLLEEYPGECLSMVSIDIANGHSILMKEMIDFVKQATHGELPIMAGNVATSEGYAYLAEAGADAVRVGIGGGSICKTRIQTGFGVPTLASVWDCGDLHQEMYPDVSIIADGGVRYPADLVKSIAAGADAVICGSVFAGTQEAPGNIIHDNDGIAWKTYRGMASEEVQEDRRGGLKPGTCAEGVSQLVKYKGSLNRVLVDFVGGLRSAMTYANASNIEELRKNAEFIRITGSGISESHAHGTRK